MGFENSFVLFCRALCTHDWKVLYESDWCWSHSIRACLCLNQMPALILETNIHNLTAEKKIISFLWCPVFTPLLQCKVGLFSLISAVYLIEVILFNYEINFRRYRWMSQQWPELLTTWQTAQFVNLETGILSRSPIIQEIFRWLCGCRVYQWYTRELVNQFVLWFVNNHLIFTKEMIVDLWRMQYKSNTISVMGDKVEVVKGYKYWSSPG